MQIQRFDPAADEAQLRRCHQIITSAAAADDPVMPFRSYRGFASWWAHGYDGNPRQTWLATSESGEPAGCYLLMLPDRENLDLASCVLTVSPGQRRRGTGTQLLAHCAQQARTAGRTRLASEVKADSPGAAFALAAGAASGITEVMRVLTVDDGLTARVAALRAEAGQRADGYRLETWLGVTPSGYLDELATVSGAMADAPRDADVEPEIWDAGRVAALEQTAAAAGHRLYSVAAWHIETGRLAAITQVGTDPELPEWAFQSLTAVLAEDRGRRLGLLVKVAMLDLLAVHEPGLRQILTGNAGGNEHMIAINDRLGFTISSVRRSVELKLA